MQLLVAYGSRRGGTAGLAAQIGRAIASDSVIADVRPLGAVRSLASYDAVIIAGAVYRRKWLPEARRFVCAHSDELRRKRTWLVATGPLDESAARGEAAVGRDVAALAERIGASGTQIFGGRLEVDATGPVASRLARRKAGDWRDPDHVERWARTVRKTLVESA